MQDKKVTIQALAKNLGISTTTISRVLNGLGEKYRISKSTIELVTQMAEEFNYSPNNIAKGLRLKKSSTIGLILPDITNAWFAQLAWVIENEARKHHYNIFLCNSNDDLKVEKRTVQLLQNWMVDGIIIVPIGLESEHLMKATKKGTPIVLIDRFFEDVDLPYVTSNDYDGAFDANQYLIDNGHRRIACFQGIVGTSPNHRRLKGYIDALKKNNIPFDPSLIMGSDFGFSNGFNHAKNLLRNIRDNQVTAIFSMGNQITLGILKAFKEEGIKIPDDLSLVTFDEQVYSDLLVAPLTTVSHINEDVGAMALKMLFDQLENPVPVQLKNIVYNTELIIRESVKNLKSADFNKI
jgi:LacI family transcriptional regulator